MNWPMRQSRVVPAVANRTRVTRDFWYSSREIQTEIRRFTLIEYLVETAVAYYQNTNGEIQ